MAIEKKNFFGGLNSDDEDRLLPNGDYRFALNIRGSKPDGANFGAIENTKGNKLIGITLPNGTSRVIGSFDYIEQNKVYYFVFNSMSNHSIYEYDARNNTISLVLQTPVLKFKSNEYITDPFIIDGLLFFRDNVNPPRRVNIERAKSNGYPLPFEESFINAIVKAPGKPAEVAYNDDSTISVNNVRGKLFQFRYKWVYLDNEESAWSPISKTPLPFNEGAYRPFLYYPLNINNVIDVTVDKGNDHVKKIKIAAREGNSGDFFLIEEIDKDNLSGSLINNYTYKFYNDEIYTSLDNDGNTGMRLYDRVPLLADGQAPIDGNKVAYAGITEGYDPVPVDMEITVNQEVSAIVPPPNISYPLNDQYHNGFGFQDYHYTPANNWGRSINNKLYILNGVSKQSYRPSPTSTPVVALNGTYFPAPFSSQGAGYYGSSFYNASFVPSTVKDRAIKIKNDATGKVLYCAGSAINEVIIDDPQSAGIRFVLSVRIEYYDIGDTDNQKTKWIKVQYTSQQGDTATTICNALRVELVNKGVFSESFVDIKADQSRVITGGGWSYGLGANIAQNQAILRIYGEAYVPSSKKDTDPSPSWVSSAGSYTGALYFMRTALSAYSDWTSGSEKHLKNGASHGVGIVYYDSPNRSGLTNISSQKTFYVPFFSEQNIPQNYIPNPTTLTIQINHLAPEWATRAQIVYTGNQTVEYLPTTEGYKGFIQFKLKGVASSSIPGAKEADITNIISYNDDIPEASDLSYSYTKGDRIRFIANTLTNSTSDYLNDYRDVEVISFDEATNKIVFKDPGITVSDNMVVEVYTPKKKQSDELYYEVGECFDVINGLHTGNVQSQTSSQPAIIDLESIGDVYLKFRVAPINSIIEDYSYSDYYTSDSWDKGRPNKVDNNIKQIKRSTTIRYSNDFIPETNINGLSRFDDFDFEAYDQQYGGIKRIYGDDKDLIVFQELKIGKVRVNQSTLYDNEGNEVGTVKRENSVLSDIVYYRGEYGIGNNPESFTVYGMRIYFVDANRGAVLRLGGDGITPISEYKMHNYFNDTFKSLLDSGNDFKLFGAYDVRFDEYILSIQERIPEIATEINVADPIIPNDSGGVATLDDPIDANGNDIGAQLNDGSSIPGASPSISLSKEAASVTNESGSLSPNTEGTTEQTGTATISIGSLSTVSDSEAQGISDTIVFSEIKNRWVTYYSFVPDFMSSNNIGLVTFKDGQLYIHNENNVYNNYYGLQFTTMLAFVSNAEPSSNKIYNHIFTESTSPFAMPLANNQYGQKTSLIVSDFEEFEGVYKAHFLRDENTPDVQSPLIEGDTMRCHSMFILLENSDTDVVKIFAVGVGVELSELTNK